MLNFAFVFASLACVGYGRRVQQSAERLEAGLFTPHHESAAAFNSVRGIQRHSSGNAASPTVLDRRNRFAQRVSGVSMEEDMKDLPKGFKLSEISKKGLPKGVKLGEISKAQANAEAGVKVTVKKKSSKKKRAAEVAAPAPTEAEAPWYVNDAVPAPAPVETSTEGLKEPAASVPAAGPTEMEAEPAGSAPAAGAPAPVAPAEVRSEAPAPAPEPAAPVEMSSEAPAPEPAAPAELSSGSAKLEPAAPVEMEPAAPVEASSAAQVLEPAAEEEMEADAPAPAEPIGMPQATAAVALAPGWEQATDPASGQPYYYNRATGESSWVPPEAPAAAPVMEEMLAPAPMPVMPVEPAEMSQEAQLAPMETSSQETALVPASEGDGQAPALEEPPKYLQLEDLINTKWIATLIPINGTWLPLAPGSLEREFVLLEDGSVVWPTIGKGGGPGTVGKWFLKGDFIEFQRFTGWGNILGMFFGGFDTYTADADINVNEDLQFTIRGFMRSFNAYMPVQAMCDFTAVRQPGRFAMISNEEEDE
mmetsp:Transcript_54295/g.99364  ORF Transcript_54295/g.99364 Transcript_54295/m.99364 type:complete len:533 (+) Transcript_54295:66-1664(+)